MREICSKHKQNFRKALNKGRRAIYLIKEFKIMGISCSRNTEEDG